LPRPSFGIGREAHQAARLQPLQRVGHRRPLHLHGARDARGAAPVAEPDQVVQHDEMAGAQPIGEHPLQPVAGEVLDDRDLV
jgi:hypothetical protein